MARRDYKNSGGRSGDKRGGRFGVLFFGILIGLVAAAVMAWYLLPRAGDFHAVESAPVLHAPPPAAPAAKPVQPAEPAVPAPNPSNYTFYDILPGNKAPKPLPPAKEQWWLQVAALKNAADADALRAKLTLLNLNVVVQATPGNPPLHRVRVGPFRSQDAAESAREGLTLNNFEARLLKEPIAQ
ncbi:SPOR domain-containing protein [Parasulfuritortus cantonensis]|uniref:SPOR domain-containing protein n=1 Tax=Parasulfuritortus cantonensis TaxID=2528202 RepID=A0A4R1BCL5_9PROT|nr:SPOR domain-containing protein [Parasulfuritortus cantonensis]TCJ14754.1 SPOR domain-containing protein [Parasulfuritortus cantonensis]